MFKIILSIFRLIRYPNLVFIGLTQWLFFYCIVKPSMEKSGVVIALNETNIWILIAASILIASSGYIINDYFDLNIDRVNKPEKIIVGKIIKKRTAIIWHWFFSLLGLLCSFWFSRQIDNYVPAFFNLITILLLWFYSASLKKKPLIGNTLIALLTSWVVFSVYFSLENVWILNSNASIPRPQAHIFKFTILYAGFAFIISLIREVVKDLEDMEGDAKYGCTTLPLVWGIKPTVIFISTWGVIAICSMIILQIYALQLRWWASIFFCFVGIIFPLLNITFKIQKVKSKEGFHEISTWLKLIMLMGILSMIFVKIYS